MPDICTIKLLTYNEWVDAAARAIEINPLNAPATHLLALGAPDAIVPPEHLALLTQKYWGNSGVRLTVGFLDNPPADLRARLLLHMNAWARTANVQFVETAGTAQVRISRTAGDGYWSYLGTDILSIPANQPTMNLDSFSMATVDSEFYRVVRHETGHTLGFPHEHTRSEIVNRINREQAITYFMTTQGWSRQQVIDQVLTPLDASALIATATADTNSIMCYWLPASIMNDGIAVTGGSDIDAMDAQFSGSVYPKASGQWESLGGLTRNRVNAVCWGPNRLDVFVRGTDNGIYHKYFDGRWGPSPTGWESLGGATPNPIKAVSWGSGRLDLFVRGTDNGIYHKWFDGRWGPSPTGWESLGGATLDSIEAVSWQPGRLDVFVRGTDNGIYHKYFDGHWGPSPTGWESLGGATPNPIKAVSWGSGRLDLFVRGTDNGIYHKWFDGRWGPSPTGWESLGGATLDSIEAVSWQPGRLDVFVRGTDNGIYHKYFDGHWGPSPTGWESLGGATPNPIKAVSWGSGRLDLFVRGTDNGIYHKYFDGHWGPSPTNWESLGGGTLDSIEAVSWAAGRLDLFVQGTDNVIYHKYFDGHWGP
ncbi:M12 family metallopeptidase [Paraburkholderia sp. SIMBA_049]